MARATLALPGRGDRSAGTPEDQPPIEEHALKNGSVRWKAWIKNDEAVGA